MSDTGAAGAARTVVKPDAGSTTAGRPLAYVAVAVEWAEPVGGPADIGAIDYAGPQTVDLRVLVPALKKMVPLAVLSGLCVATCWLWLWGMSDNFLFAAVIVHTGVYAATLTAAVKAAVHLDRAAVEIAGLRSTSRRLLDVVAGSGLAVIGLFPIFAYLLGGGRRRMDGLEGAIAPMLGFAFLLLTVTVYRHRMLYTPLARVMRSAGHTGVARLLSTVGWTKTIYEGVWLFCCALPLVAIAVQHHQSGDGEWILIPAVGAAGGCVGFVVVWIMMIIAHVKAANAATRSSAGYR